jgi:hypothetical protein
VTRMSITYTQINNPSYSLHVAARHLLRRSMGDQDLDEDGNISPRWTDHPGTPPGRLATYLVDDEFAPQSP